MGKRNNVKNLVNHTMAGPITKDELGAFLKLKKSSQQLFTECKTKHGEPVVRNPKTLNIQRLNEPFWCEYLAGERILLFEALEESFYTYTTDNGRYYIVSPQALKAHLSDLIEIADGKWTGCSGIKKLNSDFNRRSIIELLRGKIEQRDFFLDRPPAVHCANAMIVPNGSKIIQKPFSPLFRSRNQLTVPYDPKARCPRFIGELLKPSVSSEDLELIQKMTGLMILGNNRPQRIFLLQGAPNTGKTTLGLIIVGLIGRWNYTELRTNHLQQRFEMARLVGKTLVFGPDVEAQFLQSPGAYRLKSIVGGDPMDAEKKNSNSSFPFFGDLNALITSNSRLLVRLQRDMPAWERRLAIIVFTGDGPAQRIDHFDQVLLREEGPGILNFGLEGLLKYELDHRQRGDIILSDGQKKRVTELLTESDGVRRFAQKELVIEEGFNVTSDELAQAYAAYARERNWHAPQLKILQMQITDAMMELYGITQSHNIQRPRLDEEDKPQRDKDGKIKMTSVRGYRGVRLRTEDEGDPD